MNLRLLRNALAFAILGTPAAALADDAALALVVRGPVDHTALHAELERELARPIAAASDRCDAPCLDITLADGTAVVVYTPSSGAPRLRTLPLDGDTRGWPTLVSLLAGNLVRDEAGDVLAELPVLPPASTSAPPLAPVVTERRELLAPGGERAEVRPGYEGTFAFGFVPFVSTDLHRVGRVRHWLSIDLVAGVSGGSRGLTLAGVADVERGTVAGIQLAGVAAVAERVEGLQLGGVAAVSGEVTGVQVAGAAAIADRAHGTQLAGAVTVARRSAGTQIAGSTAVARTAHVQIAGAVTVAERIRGLQLAPINIARHVDGVQLGVINVGGSADGISLGLVNIVPGGRTDVEASVDSNALGTVMLRHGSRRWHNVYGVGGKRVGTSMISFGEDDGDDVWMYGLGFGPSWRRGGTLVDLDAICWQVNHGGHNDRLSLLNQARLTVAHDLGALTVVAGGALNVYVSTDRESPLYTERRAPGAEMDTGVSVTVWPSAFVGVRM